MHFHITSVTLHTTFCLTEKCDIDFRTDTTAQKSLDIRFVCHAIVTGKTWFKK